MTSPRSPLLVRLLPVPLVAGVTLAGIRLSGGAITNDFAVAMWLTAAWMGVAGVISLLIAVRFRALRWPVLGAYVVTAAVAGAYLGSSTVLDDAVDERVATVAPAAAPAPDAVMAAADPPAARNRLERRGEFMAVRHPASGRASVIRLAEGGRVLTLTGFEVDNGPDLRVYLVAGAARTESDVEDFVDLAPLKGNKGDQQYRIPRDVDLGRYATAVVWCRAFSVLFARASLAPA